MINLLKRIKQSNVTLKGDLEFVNQWEFFADGMAWHGIFSLPLSLRHID